MKILSDLHKKWIFDILCTVFAYYFIQITFVIVLHVVKMSQSFRDLIQFGDKFWNGSSQVSIAFLNTLRLTRGKDLAHARTDQWWSVTTN